MDRFVVFPTFVVSLIVQHTVCRSIFSPHCVHYRAGVCVSSGLTSLVANINFITTFFQIYGSQHIVDFVPTCFFYIYFFFEASWVSKSYAATYRLENSEFNLTTFNIFGYSSFSFFGYKDSFGNTCAYVLYYLLFKFKYFLSVLWPKCTINNMLIVLNTNSCNKCIISFYLTTFNYT